MKRYYWAEYDTDGGFKLYHSHTSDYPAYDYCILGPFDTHAEAKRELLSALKGCRDELIWSIKHVRRLKRNEEYE